VISAFIKALAIVVHGQMNMREKICGTKILPQVILFATPIFLLEQEMNLIVGL
jgi:hypothetical protein